MLGPWSGIDTVAITVWHGLYRHCALVACGLRVADRGLQCCGSRGFPRVLLFALCSLLSALCSLRSAVCGLRSAICGLCNSCHVAVSRACAAYGQTRLPCHLFCRRLPCLFARLARPRVHSPLPWSVEHATYSSMRPAWPSRWRDCVHACPLGRRTEVRL